MKISKINITSFGKLKNCVIDLCDGFNLIYGDNEGGKTTVMDFIKMMFYGNKSSTKQGFMNIRKRYQPWDSGIMSGSIEFTQGGVNYRIERLFKGRNSSDKISLINLDNGDITDISGESAPGEQFFGMTMAAFEKSVFIDNAVVYGESGAESEINARLSNITSSGEETVAAGEIIDRVQNAANEIQSPNKRGGSIAKDQATLLSLEQAVATAKRIDSLRVESDRVIAEKEIELAGLSREKSKAFEDIKKTEIYTKREKLREFVDAATAYEQCEKELLKIDGQPIGGDFCTRATEMIGELKILQNTYQNQKAQSDALTDEIAALEANGISDDTAYLESVKKRKSDLSAMLSDKLNQGAVVSGKISDNEVSIGAASAKPNITLILLGIVLIIAAVSAAIVTKIMLIWVGAVIGLMSAILGFVLRIKPNTKDIEAQNHQLIVQKGELEKEIALLRRDIENTDNDYNSALVQSNTQKNIIGSKREQATKVMTELAHKQLELNEKRSEALDFISQYRPVNNIDDAAALISKAGERLTQLSNLRTAAEYAAKGTACRNLDDAKMHLAKLEQMQAENNANPEQVRNHYDEIVQKHTDLSQELAALKATASGQYNGAKTPTEAENELNAFKEQMSEKMAYYDVLNITLEAMQQASAEQRRSFSRILDTKAADIFGKMTGGKYESIMISKDFDIAVNSSDSFGTQSIDALSKGAKEQAYFALRLSIGEIMGKDFGGLPIMLDDVFAQYDDTRAKNGFDFLQEYSKENQIIFFTCHNTYKQMAQDKKANIIAL